MMRVKDVETLPGELVKRGTGMAFERLPSDEVTDRELGSKKLSLPFSNSFYPKLPLWYTYQLVHLGFGTKRRQSKTNLQVSLTRRATTKRVGG